MNQAQPSTLGNPNNNNSNSSNNNVDDSAGGWSTASRRRMRHTPSSRREPSPTPSTASTASRHSNHSRRSGRSSTAASDASTTRQGAARRGHGQGRSGIAGRPEVSSLEVGATLVGTVTGVRDFGAFVDCGVSKDGLLHCSEVLATGGELRVADVREHLAVGERIRVRVKAIYEGKLTLTCRSATAPQPATTRVSTQPAAARGHVSREEPSAAAKAAMAAAMERERSRQAELLAERTRREMEAALQAQQAAERVAAEAAEAEKAAEKARLASLEWQALTAAIKCGQPMARRDEPPAPRVLASRIICGKECHLYDMNWKSRAGGWQDLEG